MNVEGHLSSIHGVLIPAVGRPLAMDRKALNGENAQPAGTSEGAIATFLRSIGSFVVECGRCRSAVGRGRSSDECVQRERHDLWDLMGYCSKLSCWALEDVGIQEENGT